MNESTITSKTLCNYTWEWHFFKGLSLGYPKCCVLFFCSAWNNFGEQRDSMYEHLTEGNPYSLDWSDGDYIKCPDCIIKEVSQ